MSQLEAPWTDEQVKNLNVYQKSGKMHPFTGHLDDGSKVDLIATKDGWVKIEGGSVCQTWAYDWMANRDWSSKNGEPV